MTRIEPEGLFENTEPDDKMDSPARTKVAPGQEILSSSRAVSLRAQESGLFVNINNSGWAVLESVQRTSYVLVAYAEDNYIVIANGDYKNYYLSYNRNSYVGGYSAWSDARYWAVDPVDCSPYPGLYPYSTNPTYLCCNGVKDAIDKLITVVSY